MKLMHPWSASELKPTRQNGIISDHQEKPMLSRRAAQRESKWLGVGETFELTEGCHAAHSANCPLLHCVLLRSEFEHKGRLHFCLLHRSFILMKRPCASYVEAGLPRNIPRRLDLSLVICDAVSDLQLLPVLVNSCPKEENYEAYLLGLTWISYEENYEEFR